MFTSDKSSETLQQKRREFREKYSEALKHCARFGPHEESPNDPAPPVDPSANTARDYLRMSPDHVEALKTKLHAQKVGRNARAELKRAFELASDSQQLELEILIGVYVINLFPEEWVWPVGHERDLT